ncbi:hypothetical protein GGR58DRAFT_183002 [Xylaria digitata]|nr:hypothetical protein GGR58DRAFT_183002 [Xylaria digitata]
MVLFLIWTASTPTCGSDHLNQAVDDAIEISSFSLAVSPAFACSATLAHVVRPGTVCFHGPLRSHCRLKKVVLYSRNGPIARSPSLQLKPPYLTSTAAMMCLNCLVVI